MTNFTKSYETICVLRVKYKCSKLRISETNCCKFMKILFPEDDHVLASYAHINFY